VSSLNYVGRSPEDDRGLVNRRQADQLIEQLPAGRGYVTERVGGIGQDYATKAYVDAADAQFAEISEYQSADARKVPLSSLGAPGGVAQLDAQGRVPLSQMSVPGAGFIRGPWPITVGEAGSTSTTPIKVGHFEIGRTGWTFSPLAFLSVQVDVTLIARPVVEVRIGGPEDTTYESQTPVARGYGRHAYADTHVVTVMPQGAYHTNQEALVFGPNLDARLTVWLYNNNPDMPNGTVAVNSASVWAAAAYILRVG